MQTAPFMRSVTSIAFALSLAACAEPISSFEGVWRESCASGSAGYKLMPEGDAHEFSLIGGPFVFMQGKSVIADLREGDDGVLTFTASRNRVALSQKDSSSVELRVAGKSYMLMKCDD